MQGMHPAERTILFYLQFILVFLLVARRSIIAAFAVNTSQSYNISHGYFLLYNLDGHA